MSAAARAGELDFALPGTIEPKEPARQSRLSMAEPDPEMVVPSTTESTSAPPPGETLTFAGGQLPERALEQRPASQKSPAWTSEPTTPGRLAHPPLSKMTPVKDQLPPVRVAPQPQLQPSPDQQQSLPLQQQLQLMLQQQQLFQPPQQRGIAEQQPSFLQRSITEPQQQPSSLQRSITEPQPSQHHLQPMLQRCSTERCSTERCSTERCSTVQSEQLHPLVCWFEAEVKPELVAINEKLDVLANYSNLRRGRHQMPIPSTWTVNSQQPNRDTINTWSLGPSDAQASGNVKQQLLTLPNETGARRSFREHTATSHLGLGDDGIEGIAKVLSRRPTKQISGSKSSWSLSGILPEASSGPESVLPPTRDESEVSMGWLNQQKNYVSTAGRRRGATVDHTKLCEQAAMLHMRRSQGSEVAECIWDFFEDPESSCFAKVFSFFQPFYLMATVLLTLVQTLQHPPLYGLAAAVLEITVDSFFVLEFILRLSTCPNPRAFLLSPLALVDALAAAPLSLRLAGPVLDLGCCPVQNVQQGLLLFAVPIIRLLKLLRRFHKFHLLLKAFDLAAEALPVLLFILFTIALVFSVLIYLVEQDNIASLSQAFWFTIVTMTTVGYGDIYPLSDAGIFITGVLIIITVLYMAIPLGIVGDAFAQTWQDRDRILLMQRTRERLSQWGYSACDIPVLFRLSDGNGDGELTLHEFRDLLVRMHIGFDEERILKLFASFDTAKQGTIDARAFVRGLFPSAYAEIFANDRRASYTLSSNGAVDERPQTLEDFDAEKPSQTSFPDSPSSRTTPNSKAATGSLSVPQ